jgi:effector-binding domain-containing protein
MKQKIVFSCLVIFAASLLFNCSDPEAAMKKEEAAKDSVTKVANKEKAEKNKKELKDFTQLTDQPGPIGIFKVPEMLTLCRKDSAPSSKMAESFARNFTYLEKDLDYLDMTAAGAAGSIYYNNDTTNCVFEVVYPLSELPKKKPKKSVIVVLEAAPMVIYNHYGEYSELYQAYANIKSYLDENALEQSGPLREFYITDPVKIKDHSRWLTRIMVPVVNKK